MTVCSSLPVSLGCPLGGAGLSLTTWSPRSLALERSITGSHDSPGTTRSSKPLMLVWRSSRSNTILTGTRWTILVKLPVALSGGSSEYVAPEPFWMLSTRPVNGWSLNMSMGILTRWPTRTFSSCVSLKLASTQTTFSVTARSPGPPKAGWPPPRSGATPGRRTARAPSSRKAAAWRRRRWPARCPPAPARPPVRPSRLSRDGPGGVHAGLGGLRRWPWRRRRRPCARRDCSWSCPRRPWRRRGVLA